MGFSYSSAIGQDVMLETVLASGLSTQRLIADDKEAPDQSDDTTIFGVYTDDVLLFSRVAKEAQTRVAALEASMHHNGIPVRADKNVDWELRGVTLGCDFDGYEGFLDPSAAKQLQTLWDALSLLDRTQVTVDEVRSVMGSLQWYDLLVRSKLAAYDSIYSVTDSDLSNVACHIPSSARTELFLSLSLSIFWSADLSKPYAPMVAATDASTCYGFGVAVASAPDHVIRQIGRYSEKRGDYVQLKGAAPAKRPSRNKTSAKTAHRLPLSMDSFRTVLSVRAKNPAHVNILEAEALLLWLRWLVRGPKYHNTKAVCLCDSKVTIGAVCKGRSSSKPLLRVLRRIAALSMASGVQIRVVFFPPLPILLMPPAGASAHDRKCELIDMMYLCGVRFNNINGTLTDCATLWRTRRIEMS